MQNSQSFQEIGSTSSLVTLNKDGVSLNLNSRVLVRLTEKGQNHLLSQFKETFSNHRYSDKIVSEALRRYAPNERGYSEFQLHGLLEYFGTISPTSLSDYLDFKMIVPFSQWDGQVDTTKLS